MKHRTYGTRRYFLDIAAIISHFSKAKKTMIIISIAALLFAIPELFEVSHLLFNEEKPF